MGGYYLTIKKINGHRYYYWQKTRRVGKQIKTLNKYVGPVDKVPRPAARLAYSPDPSMNGRMKPRKDSDLETGAQLYGCIPELNNTAEPKH
jgi:hypothetical protein